VNRLIWQTGIWQNNYGELSYGKRGNGKTIPYWDGVRHFLFHWKELSVIVFVLLANMDSPFWVEVILDQLFVPSSYIDIFSK